ncbi:MAG TPA: hypothetical protein VJ783_15005 [Pirellulales bacterium]|nr:hypothetical protein [Pirellulales bacterium]
MPDLLQYLSATVLAAGISAVVVLAAGAPGPRWAAACSRLREKSGAVYVLALGAGLAGGWYVLRLPVSWPPASGLSRLLTIVLPLAFAIELISACPIVPRWLAWCGRLLVAMSAGRILLHGSVYLSGDKAGWSAVLAPGVYLLSGGLLLLVWTLLGVLSRRAGGLSISLALAQAALCGGLATMLAGYVSGGAASLPLAGALVGCAVASGLSKYPGDSFVGAIGVGAVALFGLLYIGHFFGQLSAPRALVVFLSPLLCWVVDLPVLRRQPAWRIGMLRLGLVAIPLIAVVMLAKRDFDRDTLPLL